MTTPHALLVGYGSIGRRYVRVLNDLGCKLTIVERDDAARANATRDYPDAQVAPAIGALEAFPWRDSAAVIATWGPSHASIFHALADRGVKRILCEKPLATSVADAAGMVERAEQAGMTFGVNHYLRYMGVAAALKRLFHTYELGEPVAVRVEGGAAGLVTNGVHFIDLACELFDAASQEVTSTARGEAINPRSPELHFYQGTAVWRFPGDREAVLSFSNRSSLALTVRVLLRDAVAEFDDGGNGVLRRRDTAAVERFPAATRTGPAEDVLFRGRLPDTLSFEASMQLAVREVLEGKPPTAPGRIGAEAINTMIGALLSSRERRSLVLPIDAASAQAEESWPIS